MIYLLKERFGCYLLKQEGTDKSILIQFESDLNGVARSFGWDESGNVRDFLDRAIELERSVDDPGYFEQPEDGEKNLLEPEILSALLEMASTNVTVEEIQTWSEQECWLAQDWAGAVHLAASDNGVEVPNKPDHLQKYN